MRIFKTKLFARFAYKENISDKALCQAILAADIKPDADLGSGVIKQRVARANEGKSKGYRTIIFYRKGQLAFFVHGFAKKDQDNITKAEEQNFKKLAPSFLEAHEHEINWMIKTGEIIEVKYG